MKSFNYFIGAMYILSIFMFLNSNTLLMFWCLIELNMIMMISFFFFSSKDLFLSSEVCMFYFLLQSVGSCIFLLSLHLSDSLFSGVTIFLFMLAVILKMGLFPFYFWVYKLGKGLRPLESLMLLGLQKIPIILLSFFMLDSPLSLIFLVSFFFGSIFLFFSLSTIDLMISSSIYSFFWVFFLFSGSMSFFLMYYLIYLYFLYLCLKHSCSEDGPLPGLSSYLFFLGLPPFSLFFFKLGLTSWMWSYCSQLELIMFWSLGVLALIGYMKFFYNFLLFHLPLYLTNQILKKKWSLFCFPFLSFSLFLLYLDKLYKLLSSYLK